VRDSTIDGNNIVDGHSDLDRRWRRRAVPVLVSLQVAGVAALLLVFRPTSEQAGLSILRNT
jgi:hypothetical protein